jgi:hypothetical protein
VTPLRDYMLSDFIILEGPMSSGERSVCAGKGGDGVPSPSDDCTTPRAAARHTIEFLSLSEDGTEKERELVGCWRLEMPA